jgi:hypothetical protein
MYYHCVKKMGQEVFKTNITVHAEMETGFRKAKDVVGLVIKVWSQNRLRDLITDAGRRIS